MYYICKYLLYQISFYLNFIKFLLNLILNVSHAVYNIILHTFTENKSLTMKLKNYVRLSTVKNCELNKSRAT